MTILDRASDATGTPTVPPVAVTEFSLRLAGDLFPDGYVDAATINKVIAELAGEDVAAACLIWRQATNLIRVGTNPALADIAADITSGALAATVFGSKTVVTRVRGGDLRVTGRGLMTTGVEYAAWFVVEARQKEGGGSVLLAVPAAGIVQVRRPEFIGLAVADNCFVDIDAVVSADRVLGAADDLVGLPYDLGLTMGAVAVGATDALLAGVTVRTETEHVELGELRAQHAAAAALVEVTPHHAPHAGWWSKAAKVAATDTALATCVALRRLLGSATYAVGHPLNRIEADLRGLEGQAPAHAAAARAVATAPDHNHPNPKTKQSTENKD